MFAQGMIYVVGKPTVVAVGSALTKGENFGSGDGKRGLIIRTNAGCTYDGANYIDRFPILDGAGSACTNYKWVTKLGDDGLNAGATWVAASNDNRIGLLRSLPSRSDTL